MKKLFAALVISSFLISGAYAEKVCGVHDADTLEFCNGKKVRLMGIDAVESHQPFGAEAREYLKELVLDREVQVEGCLHRGWLRDMCNVTLEGKDIQAEMVRMGYAFDYPKYSNGKYASLQNEAKQAKKGVWIQSEGSIKTWDARRK